MNQKIASEEEIDVNQVIKLIKRVVIKILRLFFSIITFYKKKWIFFLLLLAVGATAGYFIDRKIGSTIYKQEVIIEPKYRSVSYIYSFIDNLSYKLGDKKYIQSLGMESLWSRNIESIEITPIIAADDIMIELKDTFNDQESYEVLYEKSENDLNIEKFRNFYKHHKIVVYFKSDQEYNSKITASILESISNNSYFRDQIAFEFNQASSDLKRNTTSLQFIDQYLASLSTDTTKKDQDVIIIADETQTTTIAALLKQKSSLLINIKKNEETLNLYKEVFLKVSDSDVISYQKKIFYNLLVLIPLFAFIGVSIFYLIRYLYIELQKLVTT
ncbi:hypothetical protein GCM10022393_06380 [Aquimarina addita]|uniref:Polysaccharide chain length determinant N-terminal domain-containing protein n=1 Tax=Aquimarina addita TaxID=870485 RepID=A0ABP7XAQ0_9FLAO